jgi:hypothetical protein
MGKDDTVSLRTYVDSKFDAYERAILLARDELRQSLELAKDSIEKQLKELNQLRQSYEQDRDFLATKDMLGAIERRLQDAINVLVPRISSHENNERKFELAVESRLTKSEGAIISSARYWSLIMGAITSIVIWVILHWLGK